MCRGRSGATRLSAPILHRFPHPSLGQRKGSLAGQQSTLPRMLENLFRVGADLFLDGRKGLGLRTAVIFNRRADDAAGIGDKVRNDQRASFVQYPLCFRRKRNIRSLWNEFGFQASDIVFANDVGPCGGNPDFTFDVDHRLDVSFSPSG